MKKAKKSLLIGIIVCILILIVLIGIVLKNTFKSYDKEVNLTPEQTKTYQDNIKKRDDKLINFIPGTGEQLFEDGTTGMIRQNKPNPDWFFEKARNERYLGKYNDAIKTLNQVFDYYENSSVAWNNLGTLYEEVGEYNLAIENYKKIGEIFTDTAQYYFNKIARIYLREGNKEKAEEYYTKSLARGGNQDSEFIDKLKQLK